MQKSMAVRMALGISVAAAAMCASAATAIKIDSVLQRWPWNNKVDITYTVTDGQDLVASNFYKIVFTTVIDGTTYTIDGVTDVGASASSGTHTVTWRTAPDGIRSTNCTMTAAIYTADAPSGDDYMIIDLNTGAISWEGMLATQEESNRRYNVDGADPGYKRTKMVLRKVAAGGPYPTGFNGDYTSLSDSSGNYSKYNSKTTWTTDRDYYAGIFLVTHNQYTTLGLGNPSSSDNTKTISGNVKGIRPVDSVSWNALRGNVAPTNSLTPDASGTFLERLNFKTQAASGITGFDLPTEVMSEITERAGSTNLYYWGDVVNYDYIACYENCVFTESGTGNSVNSTVSVGYRLPNAWGFYDTCGNVWEWCLDDETKTNLANAADAFTPACSDGTSRRYRGGAANYNTAATSGKFHASYRNKAAPDSKTKQFGFRVYWVAD